jgi:hypothetical protein
MAESNEYFDYHLTPVGWVKGSSRVSIENIVEIPHDRVLSIRHTSYMRSSWSGSEEVVSVTYGRYDDDLVQNLRNQYGFWPNHDVERAVGE